MKIAGVQMDVTLGDSARNVARIIEFLEQAVAAGAKLTIFPECAVTGYCFPTLDDARKIAEPIPGPSVEKLATACQRLKTYAIFGSVEADEGRLYNVAVLVGPGGLIGSYRKTHLPFLGVDMYATHGERPYEVFDVDDIRLGMTICYDSAFPEPSRALTLLGADLIALPTNWPPGAECMPAHVINARAIENGVYYAAVNRVGLEQGFQFIGRSRICAPNGETIAEAGPDREEILYAEIDPARARNKQVAREPGRIALDRLADRRPELYSNLTTPHHLPRPGR